MRRRRRSFGEPNGAGDAVRMIRAIARPLRDAGDLDPLLERIGEARYVLMGEATHGTAEFYDWRRLISERLIRERGFSFIAVEGDWPDCYRVNRYVKGALDAGRSAQDVLHAFQRWPTWMWANREVVGLAAWLRQHNEALPENRKVGFYGLDVYSLWDSMRAVLQYLQKHDGAAAAAARQAFECFEPYAEDVQDYARSTMWAPSCEDDLVQLLYELRQSTPIFDHDDRDAGFDAEQNALVAKNAEHYYRTMVRGDAPSWNVRDSHMVETLDRLMEHHGPGAKAIVWEHNTHVGDARYTDMADAGMVNVGQLVRERHAGEGVVIAGFSTHRGTVIAGDHWEAPMRRMTIPPAREGSWDDLLHRAGADDKLLVFDPAEAGPELMAERGHRAIGVVYRPRMESLGNYVPTILPNRYDALLYIDETEALNPLHIARAAEHEVPETYPTGL